MQRPHLDLGKICRRPVHSIALLTAAFALSSAACDIETLSARPGKHVTYHWDPDERFLCGGTVVYADRLAETMMDHYGMSLDGDGGPFVEYFWSVADTAALACPEGTACAPGTPTTRNRWLNSIYSETPIDAHELAHAVVGSSDRGLPGFLNEGLAMRWQSEELDDWVTPTAPLELDEAQLRAAIDQLSLPDGYGYYEAAYVWFGTLEAHFGPEKMGEFLRSLNVLSSSDAVDEALRRTMGISLAESVVLAAKPVSLLFNDPICDTEGVPTFRWEGAPIIIDQRDARCEDENVVNWDPRIKSIFILEFPDELQAVNLTVSGASEILSLDLRECPGEVYWGYGPSLDGAFADGLTHETKLRGRWVASLLGDIDDEGNVTLPRVEITPVEP